jgi:hypothetical protein
MEVNYWTSSTVSYIQRDASTGIYKVTVQQKGGERIFTVKHVVFATGFASGGTVNMPSYPNMVTLKHSSDGPSGGANGFSRINSKERSSTRPNTKERSITKGRK